MMRFLAISAGLAVALSVPASATPVLTPQGSTSGMTYQWDTSLRDFAMSETSRVIFWGDLTGSPSTKTYDWTNHTTYNFEVSQPASGAGYIKVTAPSLYSKTVTGVFTEPYNVLMVDANTSAFNQGGLPGLPSSTSKIDVTNLVLKIIDPATNDWVTFTNMQTSHVTADSITTNTPQNDWALISQVPYPLTGGFVLTGTMQIDWQGAPPPDSMATFHVRGFFAPVPELSLASVAIVGGATLMGCLPRRRR